jgi:hypothetical protein
MYDSRNRITCTRSGTMSDREVMRAVGAGSRVRSRASTVPSLVLDLIRLIGAHWAVRWISYDSRRPPVLVNRSPISNTSAVSLFRALTYPIFPHHSYFCIFNLVIISERGNHILASSANRSPARRKPSSRRAPASFRPLPASETLVT